jgi:hypothetical protein
MSIRGDDLAEMQATLHITDEVVEAIVRGEWVPGEYALQVAFADQVRQLENARAPVPSCELAGLLAGRGAEWVGGRAADLVLGGPGGRSERKRMPGIESVAGLGGKVAGLGLVAKLGLGTSLAAAGVAAAGIAGVLPAAANDAVRGAVEVVTPVEFDSNNDDTTNFGERVSTDATGDSDGANGVDGQQISDEAPGAANRPGSGSADEPPGQSDQTGLTRANQTPAADHAPDAPAAPSDAGTASASGDPDGDGVPGTASSSGRPDTVPSTVPERGTADESDSE